MENESLNDTQESESSNMDTSRSSTSEESKPRTPYALHLNNDDKENSTGDNRATLNKGDTKDQSTTQKNKGAIKKAQTPTETTAPHALRAPYAQPVLDASKLLNGGDSRKSSVEERLASARERRMQQQKQIETPSKSEDGRLELGLMMRKEREDQAYAKWLQSQDERKKKIEVNKIKDDAHRKEVELRKKQQLSEEKKKAEARIARTEQVYDVKMRQKRTSSSDRGVKRWSWGGGDGDGTDTNKSGSMINLASPSNTKPRVGDDRFSKSPLLVNTTHMAFASGLRSYDSSPGGAAGRSSSAGRPATAPGLTEPCTISPRLLAPTRASLARSRTAINDIDDTASQSSNASSTHTGPLRSRSKDRKSKERTPARSDTSNASSSPRVDSVKSTPPVRKPTPDRKSTPTGTRGASPMLGARRRPPSPAKTPTTSSGNDSKTATEVNKAPKRGQSPQPRANRPPSPAKPKRPATPDAASTPPRTTTGAGRRPGSPSPAQTAKATTSKTKAQADVQRTASTPPNIKPSLRTGPAQLKTKSSPATAKTPTPKPSKPTTPKTKTETPKASEKVQKPKKADEKPSIKEVTKPSEPKTLQDVVPTKEEKPEATLSVGTDIPKSLSNTSQAVSDIPLSSEAEEHEPAGEIVSKAPESHPEAVQAPEEPQQIAITLDAPLIEPIVIHKDNIQGPEGLEEVKAPTVRDSGVGDSLSVEPQPTAPAVQKEAGDAAENLDVTPKVADSNTEVNGEEEVMGHGPDMDVVVMGAEEQGTDVDVVAAGAQGAHVEVMAGEGDMDLDVVTPGTYGEVPQPEMQETSMDYFVTVDPEEPDASSPRDSLDDEPPSEQEVPENNLQSELEASIDYPPAEEFSLQSEDDRRPDAQEVDRDSMDEEPDQEEEQQRAGQEIDASSSEENSVIEVMKDVHAGGEVLETTEAPVKNESKVEEPQTLMEDEQEEESAPAAPEIQVKENGVEKMDEPPTVEVAESTAEQIGQDAPVKDDLSECEATTKEEDLSVGKEVSSATSSESVSAPERKSQPRKNLKTEEDKEAYRQAIAEKRRELKEKKEQEERERQERIRLAKIEQAKREEEARRMFEEAAAAAELQKQQEEEEKRRQQEEEQRRIEMEKKQEEEAAAKKREAAEKMKREREVQKQKQEGERMARKKRLEMIMRRTRQPDADAKPTSREPSTSPTGTPSPQNTPVSLSPAVGRSPQTESPVGGRSPLISLTPERAISPATTENSIKRNDNYLNIEVTTTPSEAGNVDNNNSTMESEENLKNRMQSQQDLLKFSHPAPNEASSNDSGVELIHIDNADALTGNLERPAPFEAFTTMGITNGMKNDVENHKSSNNMDPFSLFTGTGDEHQTNAAINGAENIINMNTDIISPKVPAEPLVPTGI